MRRWRRVLVAVACAAALGTAIFLSGLPVERTVPETAGVPPASDAVPPPDVPDRPGGSYGFSHHVFSRIDGKVVTTLSEGPHGAQVRCQTEALPCSYLDLKALYQSGGAVPPELHMTREELGTLVSQLTTVSDHLRRYQNNIGQACLDGYRTRSPQVGNMGIHLANPRYHSDGVFDLEKPEILLFAMEGAEQLTQQDIGDCVDGKWTGDPRQQIVGAAFLLPTEQFGDDHPDGFAGRLDNWHVHYHVCIGTLSAAALSQAECEKRGGIYLAKTGWMIHTYVVPEFDNQLGVFSIWNPSVWPKTNVRPLATPGRDMGGRESVIFEFEFAAVEIEAGETVVFRNADPVFHTVTAGTPEAPTGAFDSGKLFSDQTFGVRFDKPGEYRFFCRFHPDMAGIVRVK